jgi:hypothetical protein
MAMYAKVRRMRLPGRPVDQRDRATDEPVEEHDQDVAAGAGAQRDAYARARRPKKLG